MIRIGAKHVHLIGIGGIGLSAIARVLLERGVDVSGSDVVASDITEDLSRKGARIYIGHRAENIEGADLVVVTSAVKGYHVEVSAAQARNIRVVKRPEFLAELTAGFRTIAVAGTHGKTTTTAMIASILIDGGFDPTVIVGGIVPEWGSNARAGNSDWFVIEADEYDRTFLSLRPEIAVITNIEFDHPDIYKTSEEYVQAFQEFMSLARGLVLCGDEVQVLSTARGLETPSTTYGEGELNEWRGFQLAQNAEGGTDFFVSETRCFYGEFSLRVPGSHNVKNALAAIAVGTKVGVSLETMRSALEKFRGASRRFEIIAEVKGIVIVDDYAHHPTEIKATLRAARERFAGRRVWAVFQPHTYSRTLALLDGFGEAFGDADRVVITEIYASREKDDGSVAARDIVGRMRGVQVEYIPSLGKVINYLAANLEAGDVLVVLGAGNITHVGRAVAEKLQER
jgi:UDP-N-acetylmuramate--alanine ligase